MFILCCATLSDDQLDAVWPRDVGDAAVVGAVPQPHVGDEQLAGGHRDNLRRGDHHHHHHHNHHIIIIIIITHPSPEKGYTSTSGSIIFTKATFLTNSH